MSETEKDPEETGKSPEEIEAEIEDTRSELGDTVADIADKADVKKQASRKADELKEKAAATAKQVKETAAEQVESIKAASSAALDPEGGTGGDIGSGPTGDVRNSPGIVDGGPDKTAMIASAGAFMVGLALGWALWH